MSATPNQPIQKQNKAGSDAAPRERHHHRKKTHRRSQKMLAKAAIWLAYAGAIALIIWVWTAMVIDSPMRR